jgi:hypothetical protein
VSLIAINRVLRESHPLHEVIELPIPKNRTNNIPINRPIQHSQHSQQQ